MTLIEEPHVHEFVRANIWHVKGTARDLVVDAGMGIASLRERVPEIFDNDPILVVTHAHLDHAGSAYEFTDRRAYGEHSLSVAPKASLYGAELAQLLGFHDFELPHLLIDALPEPGYQPALYRVSSAPVTTALNDGDVIDLGNRQFRALHLPGHTGGCIGLFDEESGELFSGDVLYDDVLLDDLPESDVTQYIASLRRLAALPVTTVYPGHRDIFDGIRLRELVDEYVASRTAPQGVGAH
ncbi:MBL fold metallo-hydrolase [Leifsonia shinshuensis]|uniref:MBL fold metallo-hydrolase n=2 Tax=Leifsonia shinshuensis TaxID=150026 RepID=A0A7G6YGM3_9MICO|nr:MBL fold metallo-hydrolase [Leifsonia shinshuensis]